jgi:hypothetical protein
MLVVQRYLSPCPPRPDEDVGGGIRQGEGERKVLEPASRTGCRLRAKNTRPHRSNIAVPIGAALIRQQATLPAQMPRSDRCPPDYEPRLPLVRPTNYPGNTVKGNPPAPGALRQKGGHWAEGNCLPSRGGRRHESNIGRRQSGETRDHVPLGPGNVRFWAPVGLPAFTRSGTVRCDR